MVVAELHHEFWRDEVRALSLALDADGLFSIPTTIHGEGHPALWYLLLRASYDIFGTKAVLPLLNLFIAAAAVVIFLWWAPFALWWKALFVFSAIAVYEYSVMARNYSIVMLLMFVYAAIYTAPRRSPAWLVLVLFLLTQTHIIAMLLVPFYLFIWFGDGWRARRRPRTSATACRRSSARPTGMCAVPRSRWLLIGTIWSASAALWRRSGCWSSASAA